MTCEVAVMNKYALVIAADSAVTTTSGNGAERYSKGGNKIFQLSRNEPVGLMIYGSAMLNGVPWEIVIKNYRDTLGAKKFDTLQEYATSFFEFVKTASHFFSKSDLEENLNANVLRIAVNFLLEAQKSFPELDDASKDLEERRERWASFIAEKRGEIDKRPMPLGVSDDGLKSGIEEVTQAVNNEEHVIHEYLENVNLSEVISVSELFEVSCIHFFKEFESILGRTGIVFAGFGKSQFFPVVIQYDVFGFVRQDFLFRKMDRNSCEIGHATPSGIFQFAMTSSIDTFTTGVGFDTYREAKKAYKSNVRDFVSDVLLSSNVDGLPDGFDAALEASCDKFSDQWVDKLLAEHYHPMKRVIASLPIPEMVHLAETLIVLQSLKERITTHSESVGGPVDIAVITKSEGLVWIKRKHYFDADKNLAYVMRQQVQINEETL